MAARARLEMHRAEIGDLEIVRSILDEAIAWLHGRGIGQWAEGFPDEMLRAPIEAGNTWLAERDGIAVATITLQWSDEPMWGVQPPDAGYVHRLAVRRSVAGLGSELLAWADEQTASRGRSFLRLDCWSGNAELRKYYESAGFRYCGETKESTWTVSRYERAVRSPT